MSPYRIAILSSLIVCFLETTIAPSSAEATEPKERPLPPGAIARLGSLRLRHEDEVRSIAFSPDGKKIASVSRDRQMIRVWDTATGKMFHEFEATGIFTREFFAAEDFTLAFTHDGKSIAAGVKGDVRFWDLESGRESRRFRINGKGILALTFSSDNKTFYCGGADNKLYQWDIATGKQLQCWDYFEGNQPQVYESGFAAKSAVLKTLSRDGKTAVWLLKEWADGGDHISRTNHQLMVWDVTTGKVRCRLADTDAEMVVLSPDGKYVTAYTRNCEMIVWDTATGKRVKTLGDGGSVEAVAYSPDGRRVAAFSRWRGQDLYVWDLATGKECWHHELSCWHESGWEKSLAFSPDSKSLALSQWKNVRLWDVESGREMPLLEGHRGPVHTLAFSQKDGSCISADNVSAIEWTAAGSQKVRHSLLAYHGQNRSTAESYETKLRISQPDEGPPQLRELLTNKFLQEFDEIKGRYYHGSFSTDGSTVALTRREKETEIVFIDVPTRQVRSRFTTENLNSENLLLSADGKLLAVPCDDQTVVVIDSFRGKIVRRLGVPQIVPKEGERRTKFTSGTFSPDGQLLAFGTRVQRSYAEAKFGGFNFDRPPDPERIRVWQVATGRELPQFENSLGKSLPVGVRALTFSPDSKSLALAVNATGWRTSKTEIGVVPVLEVASGQVRRKFQGHTDDVASIAFSPDGKTLATGSDDTAILLWDMKRVLAPKPPASTPAAERIVHHWSNLTKQDASVAYDAVLFLAEMPDQSVPFLAERMQPAVSPSKEQIAKWIADLSDDSFEVRTESYAKLAVLHELARTSLEKAINAVDSAEARSRIGQLLTQLNSRNYSPTMLRQLRSVEVLERIASPKARRLLEVLADGAPDATLTVEAKASLVRLKRGE